MSFRRSTVAIDSLHVLAARAQLGDRSALETLLRSLEPLLSAHIQSIVNDYDAASDAVQETLILIYRKLGALIDPLLIRPWAYRIATREAVRASARLGRRVDLTEELMSGTSDHTPVELDADDFQELLGRVDALPASCRVVVRMRYLDSLSQAEIAAALKIPVGTVKSRLAYGLSILRKEAVA